MSSVRQRCLNQMSMNHNEESVVRLFIHTFYFTGSLKQTFAKSPEGLKKKKKKNPPPLKPPVQTSKNNFHADSGVCFPKSSNCAIVAISILTNIVQRFFFLKPMIILKQNHKLVFVTFSNNATLTLSAPLAEFSTNPCFHCYMVGGTI